MYSKKSGLILGFHGCDKSTLDNIISDSTKGLEPSKNNYDWLGGGIYFWENSYDRALSFAQELKNNPREGKPKIKTPSVIGAIIDLGHCLDLIDSKYLKVLQASYETLNKIHNSHGTKLPENVRNEEGELLRRHLDCAVIENLHQTDRDLNNPEYDSVRGVFFEGKDLYPEAGFREKNHIQIAIRNPDCIKGYFVPRKSNGGYNVSSFNSNILREDLK